MPDVYKACERFEKLGVNFVKKPDGGTKCLSVISYAARFIIKLILLWHIILTHVYTCMHSSLHYGAGKMKGLAFITDPDGYWIEVLNGQNMTK